MLDAAQQSSLAAKPNSSVRYSAAISLMPLGIGLGYPSSRIYAALLCSANTDLPVGEQRITA
jgi:hypothetical protein